MTADTVVRARIDAETKQRASAALAAMGLSVSDAIRLLMMRVAEEQRLPFDVKVPNATTRRAMAELEEGKGYHIGGVPAAGRAPANTTRGAGRSKRQNSGVSGERI